MKKVTPLDAATPGVWEDYQNPTPGVKPKGSQIPAEFFTMVNHELENVVTAAGLIPSDENLNQLSLAISKLAKASAIMDMPFMAGISSDGDGQDLAVQEVGRLILARDAVITGMRAHAAVAPTGADIIMDVEVNGASIFSTKPKIEAGSNTLTAGVFAGAASSVAISDGDRVVLKVTQIGSSVAGQKLAATIQANPA